MEILKDEFKILTGRTFSRNKMARILSVSKGLYLKSSVSQRVEQNILWWCESSRKTSKGVNSLKENLPRKIRLMGNIHVYVWLATCDLTSKTKGGAVSLNPIVQTQDILEQYQTQGQKLTIFPSSQLGYWLLISRDPAKF